MPRPRPFDLCAIIAALGGAALAIDAWRAGSLFRYQLAGYVAGVLLAAPFVSLVLLHDRARRGWRRVVFLSLPLLVLLALTEIAIRLFGAADPGPEVLLEDPGLGHVIAPGSGGMDGFGFRNAAAVDSADVVCVGDSQTWGFQVEAGETFAARLGTEIGLPTYQMANGAYGPVQYRELVRRALRLRPRLVVVGFYFGNDLVEAFGYAGLESGVDLRAPGIVYARPHNPEFDGQRSPNWTMALVDGVLEHSRVLGWAAGRLKSRLRGGVLDHQPGAVPFADPRVATILLPDYRLPTVDPTLAAVRDGLRISSRCLHDIASACRAANARCILLAIPTKEYCYAEWQRSLGQPSPRLTTLHAAEAQVRADLFDAARLAGCELVDLAPPCITALGAGRAPWPASGDGHLNARGHALAAQHLAEQWRRH